MISMLRILTASFAALALIATNAPVQAQGKGKEEHKEHGKGGQKEKKPKQHKHQNGKHLVGDKIKKNGKHKFHEHGKHAAFVNVSNGKIAGVNVTHAEKGEVPVKKYKTSKKMADASTGGMQRASLVLAQAQSLGSTWIGYAYIDDYGDEIIYWFEYEMILDGDTGAVEYVPVYG
jgi:hypothetical protein